MRTLVSIGVFGSLAGVLLAAPQDRAPVVGGPPAPSAQVVAVEWRYADGSRLTYEGRDAVIAVAWLAGMEGLAPIRGAHAAGALAGTRWTRTAADGTAAHGAWPGAVDAGALGNSPLVLGKGGPTPATVMDDPVLARAFPGWAFRALDVARGAAVPPARPDLERLVIAASTAQGGPADRISPPVLLDGLDAVLGFARRFAKRPADVGDVSDMATVFARLCRYDSWEGPLAAGKDGRFVAALAVGLPGQRKQAGQLTLEWTTADGWRLQDPRPPEVNGK